MLTFAYPWMFLLCLLPLGARWLLPPHREQRRAVVVPFLNRLAEQTGQQPGSGSTILRGSVVRKVSVILTWLLVVTALARPQWLEPPVTREIPARDLLLAVDLSGSMETQDFKNKDGKSVTRLAAVKSVLDDFLSKRHGDRVGLIFFGSSPFVQAPFTEDIAVCRQLLDEAQVRMAGPQTAFGDALGLAITLFDRSTVERRVLIALTDGNDTASQVPPAKAAEIAKSKGVIVHTVSVGDPKAAGEQALDIPTLRTVSETTGGLYAHAGDNAQLEAIYQKLNALETRMAQTISRRPRRDVYSWPLALGLAVTWLQHSVQLLRPRIRRTSVQAPQVPPAQKEAA